MATTTSTAVKIPCCLCGIPILPNSANQCGACLAQQFNLQELLQPKGGERISIYQCRQCRRYSRSETVFEACQPESPQLLSICLKHIPALVHGTAKQYSAKLHVADAIWVWTEPHSMRLKVRVTIRTEMENVQMQQRVLVEFQVHWKQCPDCNREFTSRTWLAIVQLRQKREQGAPRKGLAALEMALRRNSEIRKHVLQIDSCRHGLDFYFLNLPQAQIFANFLARLAAMRIKTSQKLVSTDNHSNTAHVKHTLTADMVPLCRDDLILVGKTCKGLLAGRLGLVLKVTSNISIVDASPKRKDQMDTMDITAESYYKTGGDKTFAILQTAERMIRWVVLDVELLGQQESQGETNSNIKHANKYAMANVLVARESDMGHNDSTYSCVTHLGRLIQPGDVVLGYDLESASASLSLSTSSLGVVDLEQVVHSNVVLPDVVLVKKVTSAGAASEEAAAAMDQDHNDNNEPVLEGTKRVSKRKLRRRKKQDKKQRELEETAARMGFLEDTMAEEHDDDDDDEMLDEDMQADLEAVEKEFAIFQEQQQLQQQQQDQVDDQVAFAEDEAVDLGVDGEAATQQEEEGN